MEVFATEINQNNGSFEKRIALIIGNSSYHDGPLRNPVNDADKMASTLRQVGFQTFVVKNANKKEMINALNDFGTELFDADVALFYFSGHGMQNKGFNWLLPIGADITRESDVEFEAVNAERVLAKLEGGKADRVNMVIIDACRSNPVWRGFRSAQQGLAVPLRSPKGSIIAFATAPGTVAWDGEGQNSPYVEELSKHILTPGIPVEQVFKLTRAGVEEITANYSSPQIPWENTSLKGDFFFLPEVPEQDFEVVDQATETWELIKESNLPTVFEEFIEKFPDSSERSLAEWKLKALIADTTNGENNSDNEAWALIKESSDPNVFDDFIEMFPNSKLVNVAKLKKSLLSSDESQKSNEEEPLSNELINSATDEASLSRKQAATEAWQTIKESNDPSVYDDFIEMFPDSSLVNIAKLKRKLIVSETSVTQEANPTTQTTVTDKTDTSEQVDQSIDKTAEQAWNMIQQSENPAVFNAFIEKFPDAPQRELAELKLMLLPSPSAEPKQEDATVQSSSQPAPSVSDPEPIEPVSSSNEQLNLSSNSSGSNSRYSWTAEIVEDKESNLTWQRQETEKKNFIGAQQYCHGLRLAGDSDWRLPLMSELRVLIQQISSDSEVSKEIFNHSMGGFFWTGSLAGMGTRVRTINLQTGRASTIDPQQGDQRQFMCVRGDSGVKTSLASETVNLYNSNNSSSKPEKNEIQTSFQKRMEHSSYQKITESTGKVIGCGFFHVGCLENPLKLPPYQPDFHLKGYRRVNLWGKDRPWTEIELQVEKGDRVYFYGTGEVTTCPHSSCGKGRGPRDLNQGSLSYKISEGASPRDLNRFTKIRYGSSGFKSRLQARSNGALYLSVRDWRTYPPPSGHYNDNSGVYILDIFVIDPDQEEGFNRFKNALLKANPQDSNMKAYQGM